MPLTVLTQGFALSFGLIVAIGAQNAFVLRQGLRREYIGSVVLFCALIDASLISAGVLGMAKIIGDNELLTNGLALLGAGFLSVYGWQAWQRAKHTESLNASDTTEKRSHAAIIAQAAAFTLLNPHVYLDTVLLIGSIGAQHSLELRYWFIVGACSASAIWFAGLGFGARFLAPLFARPKAWQILDIIIAIIMWTIAFNLLLSVF